MIQIVIADDHFLVREGIKSVIKDQGFNIEVVGEATNAEELLDILDESEPDIIVLDIAMPGKSGLRALKDLGDQYPEIPVLILSMHPAERYAVRAIKAGASGYINKGGISTELVTAVSQIVETGRKYISSEVADELATRVDSTSERPLHQELSDREYQVLCMIASGIKIRDIADGLSLNVRTIHTYRSNIMKKLELKTDVQLTHYAVENNLID